ncbi:alpha/beta fold hydrolase [Dongia sp.]|uniref:alpha/beta fold hydrolase n=1 Tax=Dongia sp. TaxID=1977262 RepID=UPI0035B2EAF2
MPYVETVDARLFYDQSGPVGGPDIVWVGGGGTKGRDWQRFQTPHFDAKFRSTVFDNRGIGLTTSTAPMPWTIEDFAADVAAIIRGACGGRKVALIGSSLGSAIIQQVMIDYPDLERVAILMGTGAWSTGWGWDYQEAEIDFRKAGGRLDGMMGVTHYAAMLYPARALGDRDLWPRLKALMLEWMDSGSNEESLVPQWDASLRFDQREGLKNVRVPTHVLAFEEDVEAPPQDGEEVARLIPGARLHLLPGMGHGSWYGHKHDEINAVIEGIVVQY